MARIAIDLTRRIGSAGEGPRRVDVRERRVDLGGPRFAFAFPAHSVSALRFAVTRGA
jgi:hypothetical protein